ncbi:DsbA family protein [Streptomyces halstedii]|uniref:DsbA family protein n=1 Tax=Streptomyces TaxID=1883 RepID=UPI00048E08A4|nr:MULTISPECIES: thioredoxin domain-containing protein [Streptomyces]MCW8217093.1 thioredoxin domain-containing protein [Streptomyces griseolus]MYR75929.1 thioredoxin domain-containing protein [Streptomyces sp. SID4925]MYY17782.1 thioredoxin domain-containing protein [Streptomyces sp. SID4912]SBU96990.1 Thioredoxin [Streptomyces sp. OspMP-M45]SCD97060.1 Thioredoxin [Streptomyces sp. DpondAA-D4]
MIPANTTGPGGVIIRYGDDDATHVLSVYADLRCPYCKRMELGLGAVMEQAADEDRFAVDHHFGTFLDSAAGGTGSLEALAALGAAVDVGRRPFMHYLRALYADQPNEDEDSFADRDNLLRIADEVEDLRTGDFRQNVLEGKYLPWAAQVSLAFENSGVRSTPTVLFDRTPVAVINAMGYAVTPEAFLAEAATD